MLWRFRETESGAGMPQAAGVHRGPGIRPERGPVLPGAGKERGKARLEWRQGQGGQREDQAASFKPCSRL